MGRRREGTEIESGELRHKITIERYERTGAGDYGEGEGAWAAWKTVRAGWRNLRGSEAVSAKQQFATAVGVWVIRHLEGLQTTDRIVFDGRVYDILHIDDVYLARVKDEVLCGFES